MQEVWKDVKGYDGIYKVSSYGRVKSLRGREKILKAYKNNTGYSQVLLCKKGVRKNKLVHRLVAEAFCDKNTSCNVVNHLDNNINNNNAENLEWTTQQGNIQQALRFGRMCEENRKKATEARRKRCMCLETGETFNSIVEAAQNIGVSLSTVWYACNKKKSNNGYHFKYI